MFRSILTAVALVGALAAALPAFADRITADAAAVKEQPAQAPVAAPSCETPLPAGTGLGKDTIAVGFGWG